MKRAQSGRGGKAWNVRTQARVVADREAEGIGDTLLVWVVGCCQNRAGQ